MSTDAYINPRSTDEKITHLSNRISLIEQRLDRLHEPNGYLETLSRQILVIHQRLDDMGHEE